MQVREKEIMMNEEDDDLISDLGRRDCERVKIATLTFCK